ncbi:MAG: TlyA family RNA methyltransferase [Clostridiales bacterium]|nr:TlyA family RNA methyltransferase [Clostridiales bacterium]
MRLDKALFEKGFVKSRSRAALLINENSVTVNGKIINKASFNINENDVISVIDTIGYVGRGGLKLEGAIKIFDIDVSGFDAVDIGASTGGFTECLLKFGAKSVVSVDVGHDQMDSSIKNDKRVTLLENTNAKDLTPELIGGKKDIAVMDVSFISQTEIYQAMFSILKENGIAITLVKPQFEAGSKYLNKKGIIKDKKIYLDVLKKIEKCANSFSYGVENACVSSILGGDGNVEFLILLTKNAPMFDFKNVYEQAIKEIKG